MKDFRYHLAASNLQSADQKEEFSFNTVLGESLPPESGRIIAAVGDAGRGVCHPHPDHISPGRWTDHS